MNASVAKNPSINRLTVNVVALVAACIIIIAISAALWGENGTETVPTSISLPAGEYTLALSTKLNSKLDEASKEYENMYPDRYVGGTSFVLLVDEKGKTEVRVRVYYTKY